jgi:tetratricopeptide (TPR) repeat protein
VSSTAFDDDLDFERVFPRRELERDRRLSASLLWDLQRAFYSRHGIRAWSSGTVPHYVTTNPFLARAYAHVALGCLRDWDAAGGLDRAAPVYLVELGSGPGRFAFHFLRQLLPLLASSELDGLGFTYVLTDLTPASIDYWLGHPRLAPFVEQGVLDAAVFDIREPAELVLRGAARRLEPENPLLVVANYVFDTVPHDCFAVADHVLHEGLVTTRSLHAGLEAGDPALVQHSEVEYRYRPVDGAYYGRPEYDRILDHYRRSSDATTFLFPLAALDCIGHFERLSGGRLGLLTADKGYARAEEFAGSGSPYMAIHDCCFSVSVNYDAIGRYVTDLGGAALVPPHPSRTLAVVAYLLGGSYRNAMRAYEEEVARAGPEEFYALRGALEPRHEPLELDQALAYLRLSGFDSEVFLACFATLAEAAADADEDERRALLEAAERVWGEYFPIGDRRDVAFALGSILYFLGAYPDALSLYERSLTINGRDGATTYNIGLCHYALGDPASALEWLDETLAIDPTLGAVRATRATVVAELGVAPALAAAGGK